MVVTGRSSNMVVIGRGPNSHNTHSKLSKTPPPTLHPHHNYATRRPTTVNHKAPHSILTTTLILEARRHCCVYVRWKCWRGCLLLTRSGPANVAREAGFLLRLAPPSLPDNAPRSFIHNCGVVPHWRPASLTRLFPQWLGTTKVSYLSGVLLQWLSALLGGCVIGWMPQCFGTSVVRYLNSWMLQ